MLKFRDFTKEDWYGFAGCESETPQIAEDDNYTYVLDGSSLCVVNTTLIWGADFPTAAAAALVAQAIHAGHAPRVFLDEASGSCV